MFRLMEFQIERDGERAREKHRDAGFRLIRENRALPHVCCCTWTPVTNAIPKSVTSFDTTCPHRSHTYITSFSYFCFSSFLGVEAQVLVPSKFNIAERHIATRQARDFLEVDLVLWWITSSQPDARAKKWKRLATKGIKIEEKCESSAKTFRFTWIRRPPKWCTNRRFIAAAQDIG